MKNILKKIILPSSLILMTTELIAQEKDYFVDMRAVYVNYNQDFYWADGEAFVTSLKLGYKKEIYENFEAGVVFGAIADFGLNGEDKTNNTYIYDKDGDTFSILHQAYLKYSFEKSFIELGRFEFTSPLIDSDDYFVLANSFEGVNSNINLGDANIKLGHISRMSGAWDAGYDGGSFVSMSKSPWMHKADKNRTYVTDWPNPVTTLGVDDEGISFASFDYSGDNYKFQICDYYAHELMNSIYAEVGFKLNGYEFGVQYNTFDSVGQLEDISKTNSLAIIDYSVWGAKVSKNIYDADFTLAYMGVSDDESAHLWGSWGGFPYFASGMMVSYFETSLRDASVYSLNSDFSIFKNLNTTLHIGYYDLNKQYTKDSLRGVDDGEDYMYTYGISNSYKFSDELSFTFKLAGRTLESGDDNTLVRTILKYKF
ncbi:MAG: hypothetical protein JXQ66_05400 [Campylobacterales bacterium]|nr:hypothetical protein [Campylobacterales bacterium]